MQSLRSSSITEPSTLLRTAPPLCPASVLWSSQFQPLGLLPSHRDDRFSRSIQEPDPASRRLYAGCRSGSLQDYSRTRPGSSTHPRFRHHSWHFDTSSAVRSRSPLRTIPDGIKSRLLLQRCGVGPGSFTPSRSQIRTLHSRVIPLVPPNESCRLPSRI